MYAFYHCPKHYNLKGILSIRFCYLFSESILLEKKSVVISGYYFVDEHFHEDFFRNFSETLTFTKVIIFLINKMAGPNYTQLGNDLDLHVYRHQFQKFDKISVSNSLILVLEVAVLACRRVETLLS